MSWPPGYYVHSADTSLRLWSLPASRQYLLGNKVVSVSCQGRVLDYEFLVVFFLKQVLTPESSASEYLSLQVELFFLSFSQSILQELFCGHLMAAHKFLDATIKAQCLKTTSGGPQLWPYAWCTFFLSLYNQDLKSKKMSLVSPWGVQCFFSTCCHIVCVIWSFFFITREIITKDRHKSSLVPHPLNYFLQKNSGEICMCSTV